MKLLIGGSPCTKWSIAQTKNRETEPEGLGWELFENYLIALKKFKPDFFLYENNKSMAGAIRAQITRELGTEPILINSALVSAQSRQRLYWTNIPGVEQPEDLGILLRDILESGLPLREKGFTLKANYGGKGIIARQCVDSNHYPANGAAEAVEVFLHETESENIQPTAIGYRNRREEDGKLYRRFEGGGSQKAHALTTVETDSMVAEPIRIGTIESGTKTNHDSKLFRVYSPDGKAVTLQGEAGGYGAKTGLYAVPLCVGHRPKKNGEIRDHQSTRIYSVDAKGITITAKANGGGADGSTTGWYAVPFEVPYIMPVVFDAEGQMAVEIEGKKRVIYAVREGRITIKGKQYLVKLADGFYIIRKLTVTECKRLQTVPEEYIFPVSDTQAYKMLGNGWTVDVIAHILHYAPGITTEPLEVLSMYDGMSCGRLALKKLGAHISHYYATEIDKYAVQTTQHNFPDTIQLGDAFQVRDDGWSLPGTDISSGSKPAGRMKAVTS